MSKLQFSTYDFFSYLIPGAIVLVSSNYLFDLSLLKGGELNLAQMIFWMVISYTIGHIIATPSQWILERIIAIKILGRPLDLLLRKKTNKYLKFLFPGYFAPLPSEICEKILSNFSDKEQSDSSESIFIEMYLCTNSQPEFSARISSFLNLYGFARNLTFSFIIVFLLTILSKYFEIKTSYDFIFSISIFSIIGLLYRYLKFYRLYTREVIFRYFKKIEG